MIVNARVAVEGISAEEKDTLARITEILYSTDVSGPIDQSLCWILTGIGRL